MIERRFSSRASAVVGALLLIGTIASPAAAPPASPGPGRGPGPEESGGQGSDAAGTARERCTADELSAFGDYLACRLQAHAAAIRRDRSFDATRCEERLVAQLRLAERKFGSACATADELAGLRGQLSTVTDRLALQLTGVRYVDNGNGTVTDLQTGLMWEKKDDLGAIHDVDDVYSWSATGRAPDGTAFTVFLATLNRSTSENGTGASGCFAGHCDWRLPTVDELKTILLEPVVPCGTHPCIDPIFGPTENDYYWSSTEGGSAPPEADVAWAVLFWDGHVTALFKTDSTQVRAVRTAF